MFLKKLSSVLWAVAHGLTVLVFLYLHYGRRQLCAMVGWIGVNNYSLSVWFHRWLCF